MASKAILFFSFILLLFSLLSQVHSEHKKPLPSGFLIRNLQGSQKGDKGNGILVLRNYLQRFGYLSSPTIEPITAQNDNFDDELESALKTYQQFYNLKPTGILDEETVLQMIKPRCGVPDIINGTALFHPHYVHFPGKPKWTKAHLTYGFPPGTRQDSISAVGGALQKWSRVTRFVFSFTNDYSKADLKISFQRLEHGDSAPFDGPGGVLAHATAPMDGTFHYDGDETWSLDAAPGTFHLETVGLHEIGHMLGLAHSQLRDAVMFANIGQSEIKGLHDDDITGILDLYGWQRIRDPPIKKMN